MCVYKSCLRHDFELLFYSQRLYNKLQFNLIIKQKKTPKVKPTHSSNSLFNSLIKAMQVAAIEDQPAVLLIDQSLISYLPDVMKTIEAILEGSEIPDLFGDDLEGIANPLRNAAQLEGYQDSLASYFLKRKSYFFSLFMCYVTLLKLRKCN